MNIKTLSLLGALICLLPLASHADVSAPLGTGSRTTPDASGIHATQQWGTGSGFEISWKISIDNTQPGFPVHYIYTLSNASGGDLPKDISHFIVQISQNATINDFVFATPPEENPQTYTSGNGNPGIPGPIYGLKFNPTGDASQMQVEFWSTRDPVWGNFYAKDGGGTNPNTAVFAYNTGFLTDPATVSNGDYTMWIPVPDSSVHVPEPATMLILGSGMAISLFLKKRKQ